MSFAQFFMSTVGATTTVTMFGVSGNWVELPDVFSPILYIQTVSTAITLNEGLWIESGTTIGAAGIPQLFQVQVLNYEPGTKWFLVADDNTKSAGPLGTGIMENGNAGAGPRRWTLFYRTIGEGPDPARML